MEQEATASFSLNVPWVAFLLSRIDIAFAERTHTREITRLFCFFLLSLLFLILCWSYVRVRGDSDQKEKKLIPFFVFFRRTVYSAIVTSVCDRLVDMWSSRR
jgi:hypothetical protein